MGLTDEALHDAAEAARILRAGGLVAFPTETVYGLGADAEHEGAVRRVFAVKGRPADHPLIVHVAEAAMLAAWTTSAVSPIASQLAERFWPGPLTLIVPRGARVPHVVTGGQETVGLRVPAHPLALAMLRAHGGGVAAPSANRFGKVSPTTAAHVRADLGTDVDFVLDGGPCDVGIESTIVDVSGAEPVILRPGGVTKEELEGVIGRSIRVRTSKVEGETRAPGVLESHYAPNARVVLVERPELAARVTSERAAGERVAVLASVADLTTIAPLLATPNDERALIVLPLVDSAEALAQRLYAALRDADHLGATVIVVPLPEAEGLGLALRDRLEKAAAAR
ncbi:threonylcarbamoyl-AMP synthase [Myxococcota bacterium]|nr:threonylcarbamoyl-AMP synthase [Myxococcota bacterium]